jgi:hypothetical protein
MFSELVIIVRGTRYLIKENFQPHSTAYLQELSLITNAQQLTKSYLCNKISLNIFEQWSLGAFWVAECFGGYCDQEGMGCASFYSHPYLACFIHLFL